MAGPQSASTYRAVDVQRVDELILRHVPELHLAGGNVAEGADGQDVAELVVVYFVSMSLAESPSHFALDIEDRDLEIGRDKQAIKRVT